MTERPFRILPRVDELSAAYWQGGADGKLRILRCNACGYYIHPPSPRCAECMSKDIAPQVVSGRATVHTFTVNHHAWIPGFTPPYVVAIVTLEEQESVRIMTNILDCPIEEVSIGMPVEVTFEQHEDVWVPLFRPSATAATGASR